jgi:hypothetical protein
MALHKITKKSLSGSLLVQFKYTEYEGTWTHSSSSNSYAVIGNKSILITPFYPTSILETSTSFTIGDSSGTNNTTDRWSVGLFCDNSLEYEQTELFGLSPFGDTFSHTGGRNDRLSPSRRQAHTTNIRKSSGFTHAYIPRQTNRVEINCRVRNQNNDRDFTVNDFFMIVREIGIPADQTKYGSVTFDNIT